MANEDRLVRGCGGPGGIRCACCGGGVRAGYARHGARVARRKAVRAIRHKVKRESINDEAE